MAEYQLTANVWIRGILAEGEIDAVYSPRTPEAFRQGRARRLFADPRAEEERYFAATGIFPVMHVVVLRREAELFAPETTEGYVI